jgi:hypothetical protein
MPNREISPGPTGQRVAENVATLRESLGYTKTELGRLLADLGRPMTLDVLTKLESQHRRVDPDDLVALAVALRVTPNRLLLTGKAGTTEVQLTPARAAPARDAWAWACGEKQLQPDDGEPYRWESYARFPYENRPHRGRGFTAEQEEQHDHVLRPLREAIEAARAAGIPADAVLSYVESTLGLLAVTESVRDYVTTLQHDDSEESTSDGQR